MKLFSKILNGVLWGLLGGAALAQASFPSRPVAIMVPYPAGSASDFTARAVSETIGTEIGGQVIVENLGGAAGAIAAAKVLGAPADGQYLFQGSPSELILAGLVNKSVKIRPEDFRVVAPVATSHLVVIASSKLPANSLDELVDLAQAQARKNQPLAYGSTGPGTLYHLLGELLSKRVAAPLTHVPYRGGAPLIQDLMGGLVDFAFVPYQASYADFAKQGRLKIIGSLEDGTLPAPFQNVQSYADTRVLKDFHFSIWTAYMVKQGTPQPVVDKLGAAVEAALKVPHARAQLEAQAKTIFAPMTAAQKTAWYAAEVAKYREIVKTVGYVAQ